jgi:hypothetical protein
MLMYSVLTHCNWLTQCTAPALKSRSSAQNNYELCHTNANGMTISAATTQGAQWLFAQHQQAAVYICDTETRRCF